MTMLCDNFSSCGTYIAWHRVTIERTFVKRITVAIFMSEVNAFLATLKSFSTVYVFVV